MGWLFGQKKPKVPFPEGKPYQEGALRVPRRLSSGRVIEPMQVKAALGLERPFPLPEEDEQLLPERYATRPELAAPEFKPTGPHFVKVEVYQQILGEIDSIRSKANQLNEVNKVLGTSEYNEEHNFTKLRRAVKNLHDRLLQVDKNLFKT